MSSIFHAKKPETEASKQDALSRAMVIMESGDYFTLEGRGGWKMQIVKMEAGFDFVHFYPIESGLADKFFQYSTEGNPYGAGKIFQEPSLGKPCPPLLINSRLEKMEEARIVGALVLDADGRVAERFSWSNVVFIKGGKVEFTDATGELFVDGVSKGFLKALFLPDKNRLDGYVGVFTPARPQTVKVLEMENLLLASI